MTRRIGFQLMICCFPLRERDNWLWGRHGLDDVLCIGPVRFRLKCMTVER